MNALGTGVMLATFLHTGGLTGAEVGVAAATAFLNQKLLAALFGEAAMAELVANARRRLNEALTTTFDEERERFDRLLPAWASSPDCLRLRGRGPPRCGRCRAPAEMTVRAVGPLPRSTQNDPLERCLDALVAATDAAEALGVGVDVARPRTTTRPVGSASRRTRTCSRWSAGRGSANRACSTRWPATRSARLPCPPADDQRSRRVDPGAGGRCVVAGPCLARRRCDPHARRR